MFICLTNDTTYLTGDERNFVRFYLKTLRCKARVVPALYVVGHFSRCVKCACAWHLVCVSVCAHVCLSVHESCHYAQLSVQPKVPTASAQYGQYGVFSLFKSYGVKKPTSLCMCLPQHDMAPMERHLARYFGLFWFFQSLTAGYKLPGIVRERATSDSSVQLVQGFFVSVYFPCSLTRALSKSLPHAQQLFSASTRTPGQILAPRVCTLVLFI